MAIDVNGLFSADLRMRTVAMVAVTMESDDVTTSELEIQISERIFFV